MGKNVEKFKYLLGEFAIAAKFEEMYFESFEQYKEELITMYSELEEPKVYALVEEISDQYETSKVIGIYSSKEKAESVGKTRNKRTYVKEFEVDKFK